MSSFGEHECVSEVATEFKVQGSISGGYYSLNYNEICIE